MDSRPLTATSREEQDDIERVVDAIEEKRGESGKRTEVLPKTDSTGRKTVHWHQPDRRADQSGMVLSPEPVVGRQTREPCYETVYNVRNPGGYLINEKLYRGRVVVAQCVADYLTEMDRNWEVSERSIFRNNRIEQNLRHFDGSQFNTR